jgi:DNA repair protein RadC
MQTSNIQLHELTVRYTTRTDALGQPVIIPKVVRGAEECAAILTPLLHDQPVEVFVILCLSTKHHEVSRGSLDATIVHPREVFKPAFLSNAAAIVVAHNHPSGDPTPSRDDLAITKRLVASGELLGVTVLDHLVIGAGRYVSFKNAGLYENDPPRERKTLTADAAAVRALGPISRADRSWIARIDHR